MMEYRGRTHYKKCSFRGCKNTTRIAQTSFHSFPVRDKDRCVTWLVNSGNDDWVELDDAELVKKYICGYHFDPESFHESKRLRKDAVPRIYDLEMKHEISSEDKVTREHDYASKSKIGSAEDVCALQQKILKMQHDLEREKCKNASLRYRLKLANRKVTRLTEKLGSGDMNFVCFRRALEKRINGKVGKVNWYYLKSKDT